MLLYVSCRTTKLYETMEPDRPGSFAVALHEVIDEIRSIRNPSGANVLVLKHGFTDEAFGIFPSYNQQPSDFPRNMDLNVKIVSQARSTSLNWFPFCKPIRLLSMPWKYAKI